MKTTNEIQKQLELKADAYIEQKAQEMYLIHEEISNYLGANGINHIYYINNYNEYKSGYIADRELHFSSASPESIKGKYKSELNKNYKEFIVKKYTKELLTKMEIF